MSAPLTIAVTGLHRGDNPHPGAAVIRSLRRRIPDLRVIGLSYDPLESGLYSHDIDRLDSVYLLPFPMKGAEALRERILHIHEKEKFSLLIPCLDAEMPNFIAVYPDLQERGVLAMLPPRAAFEKRAKENLAKFCKSNGIHGPITFVVSDAIELVRRADELGYPLYVKGKYCEAWLVHSQAELTQKYEKLVRTWGLPVIVQEALIGDEYDVLGLAGESSEIVGHCAIRKMLRTTSGKGFAGIVVDDPNLLRSARHIIKALGWKGPFEIEFLKVQGRPHALFEINPRFPAWADFPSQIGCNLPVRLVELLLGRKPSKLAVCEAGQMFIRHSIDLVGDIAEVAKLTSDGEYFFGSLAARNEVIK